MHLAIHRQQLKSAMLPIAMLGGAVFYKWMGHLSFLSPYLIFAMLFVTYCKLNPHELRPKRSHILLLSAQAALGAVVYLLIAPFNHTVAEGLFVCVFMPTATAAPVITAMLGGSISFVATYSLICNLAVAVIGPFVLAAIGDNESLSFMTSTLLILSKVAPLLICPLILAIIFRKTMPKAHKAVAGNQQLSFYMWAVSLFIIVGNCVSFVINHWDEKELPSIILMIVGSFATCVVQYVIGRRIGKSLNDITVADVSGAEKIPDFRVSTAQSLMQKNTVLGVWIAMTYMTPIASVAPAAYIAWHNLVNSWQLWKHENNKTAGEKHAGAACKK